MEKHIIISNRFLLKDTRAYYTLDYYGREYRTETQFILDLKNTFNNKNVATLARAKARAILLLQQALVEIIANERIDNCTVVAVPRAKSLNTYYPSQLYLIEAISNVAQSLSQVTDGTTYIQRHTNTKTTHLKREIGRATPQGIILKCPDANDGREPYPGITKDTCTINTEEICGKTIILVDDIYTKNCNIDEDCIQTLYDAGAKNVIFYSFAKTFRG